MRTKSKLIAMMSGLTLAFTGVAGSYAYFTTEKTASQNKISIGKLPKAKVKIFASTGPLYSNAFGSGSNSATGNYIDWLDVASQYVAQDMMGNSVGVVGNDKGRFENLSSGSTVDVKSNIGTFGEGNTSWMGSKENAENENGNMVHYVVAIFNEANKGEEAGRKLNYKNENVKIERYDNFKGESGKTYKLRKEGNVSLSGKEDRIRTFDFDGIKFVQDGEHGKPSEDADLIVFDVGNIGYFTNGTEQKDLNILNNTLIGEESLFDENNNRMWPANNPLSSLASQMSGIDKKAKLLNSVCNVSFKYTTDSSYIVSDSYTVNMIGSRVDIVEEKPEKNESADETKPTVPGITVKPEVGPPTGGSTNIKPGIPVRPETPTGPNTGKPVLPTRPKPEVPSRPVVPVKPEEGKEEIKEENTNETIQDNINKNNS